MKNGTKKKIRTELLSKSTSAESACCKILDSLGVKYIRQYPITTPRCQYFADIFIPALRLVVEIDGAYHFTDRQERLDGNRSANIRRKGLHVCRLTNRDARKPEKVIAKIKRFTQRLHTGAIK